MHPNMTSIFKSVPRRDRPDVQLKTNKAYIAVMGATGSGKSSLISSITGKEGIVGHELESGVSRLCMMRRIDSDIRRLRNI